MMMAVRPVGVSASHLRPLQYVSAAATHPGCVRKLNEDACLDRPHVGLWAVADGMGGHEAGDIASSAVIDALSRVESFETAFAFRRGVRTALFEVNADLQARAAEQLVGTIGATVVALLVHGSHYACVWAGDSRAYLLRDGQLQPITRDHSLVAELVASGQLPATDARRHANAHVVTRAVGAKPTLELDGVYGAVNAGDRFLLCSDGLGVLPENQIQRAMSSERISLSTSGLLRAAIAAGAPDNVTIIAIEAIDQ